MSQLNGLASPIHLGVELIAPLLLFYLGGGSKAKPENNWEARCARVKFNWIGTRAGQLQHDRSWLLHIRIVLSFIWQIFCHSTFREGQ